jgi:pyruvate, water dikinase
MKLTQFLLLFCLQSLLSSIAFSQAVVMNPGKAVGQLLFISQQDVLEETEKYKSLNPLSIPVFAELPLDLSVVAGVITLKQQNLLSHVQIKSRARKTPNLDISYLEDGVNNPLLASYKEGDFIMLELGADGSINITASTEIAANEYYKNKKVEKIELKYDLNVKKILNMDEMSWLDFDKVGSKAANYAELAKALNSPERTVVRPSMAIPFAYYSDFIESNPALKQAIQKISKDPLMKKVTATSYREKKLKEVSDLIWSPETLIKEQSLNEIIEVLDTFIDKDGNKRKVKLRSSTNSEDLPNFNGAGLYTSMSYKPTKKGKEISIDKKKEILTEVLKTVWGSVWNQRAFEERSYFGIPHDQVYMGIQINPSFSNENADGVVVTKNIAGRPDLTGKAVYIETQRGDMHSVANPEAGVKPEKILVFYDETQPLNQDLYQIQFLQNSNIADDMETILDVDNPNPVMFDNEIKDIVFQSLKAVEHFKPIFSNGTEDFALDLEFKVDQEDNNSRQVYLKQARPYIN